MSGKDVGAHHETVHVRNVPACFHTVSILGIQHADVIYWTTSGDGTRIADKFKEKEKPQGEVKIGTAPFHWGLTGYPLQLDSLLF